MIGLGQVCRIERTVKNISTGKTSTEVSYAVTSLSPDKATAEDLLRYNRGQWGIENRLHQVLSTGHWALGTVMVEDTSQTRSGDIPKNPASLRNAAISAIRLDHEKTS